MDLWGQKLAPNPTSLIMVLSSVVVTERFRIDDEESLGTHHPPTGYHLWVSPLGDVKAFGLVIIRARKSSGNEGHAEETTWTILSWSESQHRKVPSSNGFEYMAMLRS
eukprot:1942690-Amphidinium_carterae.1